MSSDIARDANSKDTLLRAIRILQVLCVNRLLTPSEVLALNMLEASHTQRVAVLD